MCTELRPLSWRARLSGPSPAEREEKMTVECATPKGTVEYLWTPEGPTVRGVRGEVAGVEGRLRCSGAGILAVKRGLKGMVGNWQVTARRPKFGLRLRDREVDFTVGATRWRSETTSANRYQIVEPATGRVVFERASRKISVADDIEPHQVMAALLFQKAEIVQMGSFLNALTL